MVFFGSTAALPDFDDYLPRIPQGLSAKLMVAPVALHLVAADSGTSASSAMGHDAHPARAQPAAVLSQSRRPDWLASCPQAFFAKMAAIRAAAPASMDATSASIAKVSSPNFMAAAEE